MMLQLLHLEEEEVVVVVVGGIQITQQILYHYQQCLEDLVTSSLGFVVGHPCGLLGLALEGEEDKVALNLMMKRGIAVEIAKRKV
jgi:hypothetical protein